MQSARSALSSMCATNQNSAQKSFTENVEKPTWCKNSGFKSHSQISEQGYNRSLNITAKLKSRVQSLDLCGDKRTGLALSHAFKDTDGVSRSRPCDLSYIINSHAQHLARLLPNAETTGAFFWEEWNISPPNSLHFWTQQAQTWF